MKNLLYLFITLFALMSCNKDPDIGKTPDEMNSKSDQIRWYGAKLPKSIQTKSVADGAKSWNPNIGIHIKFINSPANPQVLEKMKLVASEWEEYAGIKFHFVAQDKKADVRIAFDWNGNDWLTWSYTGTDAKYERSQNQPTTVFGGLEYLEEKEFRGDVLRVFGQILGLEYEQRHQEWSKKGYWKSELQLQLYWESQFDGLNMDWDEIREYVFDPLTESNTTQLIASKDIDELSIMAWPYYNRLQTNKILANYELSEGDKIFIAELYPNDEITLPSVSLSPSEMKKKVIAHHGYWAQPKERNSLYAHSRALTLGIHGAQFDIWQTDYISGEVVASLDSIVGGYEIEKTSLSRLRAENVKNANGEPIPMWGEFLYLSCNEPTKIIINIKASQKTEAQKRSYASFISDQISICSMYDCTTLRADMMSTHWPICEEIGKYINRLPAGNSITYLGSDRTLQELKDKGIHGVGYNIDQLKSKPNWINNLKKNIAEAHSLGITVNVSTVNNKDDMKILASLGVDFITTDYPVTAINCFQ